MSVILLAKCAYSGAAKNYNLGQQAVAKAIGKSYKQTDSFYGETGGGWEGLFGRHWRQAELRQMPVSHWLSCWGAGFLVGEAMYIFSC